ncbi:MAG: aminotransferase class V-fold PLP-dependent enzyme [Candidatus Heimdallarchaeota archaeon]|nr:aminotransferase class V-fold PLP-dependent enzyme [Candidatus Heimdallarchaeota archaeon]
MSDPTPREQMGINPDFTYLNHASIGPLPRSSSKIIRNGFKLQMEEGERKIDYPGIEELWELLTTNGAKLVGGDKEGITITPNTAAGLHIVAEGLTSRYSQQSNIVIPDVEFVTNSYTWQQLTKKYHMELRFVNSVDGRIDFNQWENRIDENTVFISLSHIQSGNGFTTDLKQLVNLAHSRGALVVVDAIQGLGAVPFDAKKYDVDFVAAAAYKWMLGPLGKGLFYVKPELVEKLDTVLVGWFSTPNFRELYHQPFVPWPDARIFQQSMIDPTLNGFNESMQTLLNWGVADTYSHIIRLHDYLIELLVGIDGFSIGTSLEPNERSGILIINHVQAELIVRYLETLKITVSFRAGGIRISPHRYNTKEDIDALIDGIKSWIGKS